MRTHSKRLKHIAHFTKTLMIIGIVCIATHLTTQAQDNNELKTLLESDSGSTVVSLNHRFAAFIPETHISMFADITESTAMLYVYEPTRNTILFTTDSFKAHVTFSPDEKYMVVSQCTELSGGSHPYCTDSGITVYETDNWTVIHHENLLQRIDYLRFADTTHLLVTGCASYNYSTLTFCNKYGTQTIVLAGR